ncbi:MAG: PAS domain-containing protein [Anaerolineae bacterium]|nr:PAS domain-containing protein [Anaerolineae bacterium]
MDWQQTPYFLPLLITAAISTALAALVGRRRSVSGSVAFVLLMLALTEWSIGYALELASANLPAQIFWAKVEYLGIVSVPPLWLAFALAYTGQNRWLTRRYAILMSIIPALTLILVWSNEYHHLLWREIAVRDNGTFLVLDLDYGAWFWVNWAYAYLMLFLGTLVVFRAFLRAFALYRKQSMAMFLGALIPWIGNLLYVFNLNPFPNLDLTPFSFTLTGAVAAWAFFRLRLLDIVPIARGVIVENIDDGVIVLDDQARIVDINPVARQIIGNPDIDPVGQSVEAIMTDVPDLVARYRDVSRIREEIVLNQGGVQRHIDLRILPLHSQRGHLGGRLVVLSDITEQKSVQMALTRQMRRQATLYRFLIELGEHWDPQAIARMAVQAVVELTDWPAVSVLLPDKDEDGLVVRAVSGGGLVRIGQRVPHDAGMAGRAFVTAQTQRVRGDKRVSPGERGGLCCELAVPFERGGRVLGVLDVKSDQPDAFNTDGVLLAESLAEAISLALDNARLFQSTLDERQRLLVLIEASRDGIILIGVDGRVLVINAAALDLLGLAGQPQDWTDRPMKDALLVLRRHAPGVVWATLAEARRIRRGDDRPGEGEYTVSPRAIHWDSLPVMADMKPMGRLLVLHDVTKERQLDQVREDLTHAMVHDLRNPLTGISVSLELLEGKAGHALSPAQRRVLRLGQSSAQKMLSLVNAILDTSRLESGRMPINIVSSALRDIVCSVLAELKVLAEEKNLYLEENVPATLPHVLADVTLIERVLVNLIGNGVKFTPNGGVIRIEAKAVPALEGQDGQRPEGQRPEMHISVFNSGSFITPELRGRLFQRFATGQDQASGSGLGLAFCKLAVEAHGGRIWVESEPESGTAFVFTLPTQVPGHR